MNSYMNSCIMKNTVKSYMKSGGTNLKVPDAGAAARQGPVEFTQSKPVSKAAFTSSWSETESRSMLSPLGRKRSHWRRESTPSDSARREAELIPSRSPSEASSVGRRRVHSRLEAEFSPSEAGFTRSEGVQVHCVGGGGHRVTQ